MGQPALKTPEATAGTVAIDCGHLARMTFGDAALERELLQLFDRQAELLLGRMRSGDAGAVSALAHTLKGSALGVGALLVAAAAEAVERAAAMPGREDALDRLAGAIGEARAAIAGMLARSA
ncbi:MAG: Hpt domain-containing protein [Pseudolabrys sp.]